MDWPSDPIYSIKRHGTSLANCDAEPVQTPGCVQNHGALLILRPHSLTIAQVSENISQWVGRECAALLEEPVSAAIGADAEATLRQIIETEPIDRNPLFVCSIPPRGQDRTPIDLAVHAVDGSILLELERGGDRSGTPDYYALMKTAVSRLQTAMSLREFCDIGAQEFRIATQLDRVMIYRFHADGHGEVFAESKRDDLPSWLGLHYPADDIPQPARRIFENIWVRPVPDVRAPLHEMVPLAHPDTGRPVDMTQAALRGTSVMYTEYMQNMGVAASLTMPIRRGSQLWGLVACHHYAGPAHFPYDVRAACELLAQVFSLQHKAAEDREHFTYRLKLEGVHNQLVATAAHEGGLAAMTDGTPNLLDAIDAGGAALYHRDRWWRTGATPSDTQLTALADWLLKRPEFEQPEPIYATDCLTRDYPGGLDMAAVASGLMASRLSRRGRQMMLWFRPEIISTVNWAGNPHDKPTVPGPHGPRLTPRASFEIFTESVRNRSHPWHGTEIESVARLRLLIMELVVSRAEHLAVLNADLTRSNEELDAFAYIASHDLKEPLRGIYKYAQQLLDSATVDDGNQRAKLESLLRLTVRMDTLLDSLLHFSRVGRTTMQYHQVDLNAIVHEAIEMLAAHDERAESDIRVPRRLPSVRCDAIVVREIFQNLISNALKYNDKPTRSIEIGYHTAGELAAQADMPPEAHGHTVYWVRDNGIGIAERHFAQVFSMFKRLHGRDQYGGGTGAGLTIVKKLVQRHGGAIWLRSVLGAGTTFFFTVPSEDAP